MKRAAWQGSPNRASRTVASTSDDAGLDGVLLAHAAAARAAHVVGSTLIRARELPDRQYEEVLHHVTGLLAELHAERLDGAAA